MSLPKLFEVAGARMIFDADSMRVLVAEVEAELSELEGKDEVEVSQLAIENGQGPPTEQEVGLL